MQCSWYICKMIKLTEIGSPYISVIPTFKDRFFFCIGFFSLSSFFLFHWILAFGMALSSVCSLGNSIKMKLNQTNIEHEHCFSFISPFIIFASSLFCLFLVLHSLESSHFVSNHSSILAFTNFPLLIFRSHFPFSLTSAYFLLFRFHFFLRLLLLYLVFLLPFFLPGKLSMTLPFLIASNSYWCWAYRIDGSYRFFEFRTLENSVNFMHIHAHHRFDKCFVKNCDYQWYCENICSQTLSVDTT